MKQLIKNSLTFIAVSLSASVALSEEQTTTHWTAGVVSMATRSDENSLAALPWLSYRTENFSINPMQVALTGAKGGLHWQAGLGLDFNELFENTQRSFLAQLSGQYYWGPLRFTSAASSRLSEITMAWQNNSTVGSQFPLGQGMLGAEIGLTTESSEWDDDVDNDRFKLAPTAAIQYGHQFGQWQTMVMAQFQGSSVTTDDTAEQTYSLLMMRSW